MKVSTLNADGTWTHDEIDLGEEFEAQMRQMQADITAKIESGELAGWCDCHDGEARSVLEDEVVPFDYRTGDEPETGTPQNLGASHGCWCTVCRKLVQSG